MDRYLFKIKHIILFCSAVLLTATVGFGLFRWLLTFGMEVSVIKKEVLGYVLPTIVSGVLFWNTLRKRFWIIEESKARQTNWRGLLQSFTWMALYAMMMLSGDYVMHRFSTLQKVENVEQIKKHSPDLYYEIDDLTLQPHSMGSYVDSRTIPKRIGTDLRFTVYVVFPFTQSANVWYAISYSKTTRYTSEDEVEKKYTAFLEYCNRKINKHDFQHNHIFERVTASDDRDGFLRAIERQSGASVAEDALILRPLTEGYVNKSDETLKWIFGTFGIWIALTLILLGCAPINDKLLTKKLTRRNTPKRTNNDLGGLFREILIPSRSNWPVALIFDAIILYFLVMTIGGVSPLFSSSQELFEWGALRSESLSNGEWWRIVTSMFMHGNIMHLFGNIVMLGVVICFAVNLFKPHKTAIIFILSGICADTTAALLFDGTYVGASGAIMGLTGALFAVYICHWKYISGSLGIGTAGLLWLVLATAFTLLIGIGAGISNTAHITGLFTGAILGLFLFKPTPQKPRRKSSNATQVDHDISSSIEEPPMLAGKDVVIKNSIRKNLLYLCMGAIMTTAAIFSITIAKDNTALIMGIIGCIFFGGGMIVMLVNILKNNTVIVITPTGFEYKVSLFKTRFVPWSEVASIHRLCIHRNDFVCVNVKDRAQFDAHLTKFQRTVSSAFSSLPPVQIAVATAQIDATQIIEIISKHLDKYNEALSNSRQHKINI